MPSRVHRLNAGTAATRKESAFRPRPWLSQILVDREETHLVAVTPMVSNGLHFRSDTGSCREVLVMINMKEEAHRNEPIVSDHRPPAPWPCCLRRKCRGRTTTV